MATTLSYKDINITFKKHPVTNDVVVSRDASAIKQSIVNLLLTNKGERLMNPEYGSDIRRFLFEPLDYGTSALVKQNIVTTIGRFEPRISVQEIVSRPDFENNGFEITMTYSIVRTSNPQVTVDFYI